MKYTVDEIDALRNAVKERAIWGTCYRQIQPGGTYVSSAYNQSELDKKVEEQVRTYMMAGIKAHDLVKADAEKAPNYFGANALSGSLPTDRRS